MTDTGLHDLARPFRVSRVTCVDRPELRGETVAPVSPGTRVTHIERYATQGEAQRAFRAVLNGAWDFASEYVAAVSIDCLRARSSPRMVRRRVERTRAQLESQGAQTRSLLQVAAVRRTRARGAHPLRWMFPLVWWPSRSQFSMSA